MASADEIKVDEIKEETLCFLAWGRIWSPLTPEEERERAWRDLALPGRFAEVSTGYWSVFHAGVPQPPCPTLLHAALALEGNSTREDWMRAADYLELSWNGQQLPPDQLGAACEVFAIAIDAEEPAIVSHLRQRYLRPWVEQARLKPEIAGSPVLGAVVEQFLDDLKRHAAI